MMGQKKKKPLHPVLRYCFHSMIVRTEANVKAEGYRKLVRRARENQAIG